MFKREKRPMSIKFARLLSFLGLLAVIACTLPVLITTFYAIFIVILIILIICTIGVLLLSEDFRKLFDPNGVNESINNLYQSIPVFATIGILCTVLAIVIYVLNLKRKKTIFAFIFNALILVFQILALIVYFNSSAPVMGNS